jgi:signal peptidase
MKKFWETDNYGLALLRDIVVAFLIVAVIISAVYAYSGSTTPLVAVQSGSMEPNINIGDVVLIKTVNYTQIVTYKEGKATNYERFGNYGDVIVYKPDGDSGATPIIHRAMDWVNAGDKLPDGETAVNAGFITKGDANQEVDQPMLFGGMPPVEPVKPEWIVGVAQQPPIPWVGNLRLALPTVTSPLNTVSEAWHSTSIFHLNYYSAPRLNALLCRATFTVDAKIAAKVFFPQLDTLISYIST